MSMSVEPGNDDSASLGNAIDNETKRAKRSRVCYSCTECHRRKQKCGLRNQPYGSNEPCASVSHQRGNGR
jgi:hypothetical protein